MPKPRARTTLLKEWRGNLRSCQRLEDDRARAASLALCRAMVDWLQDRSGPPSEDIIRAALRGRPSDAVFYGGLALGHIAALDPAQWPMVMSLFQRASIRACDQILTYMKPPVPKESLIALVRAAFQHPSYEVRRKAVQKVYDWRLSSLPSLLAELRKVEADPLVLREISEYEALHRDGFYASFDRHTWSWCVRFPAQGGIGSADIPAASPPSNTRS